MKPLPIANSKIGRVYYRLYLLASRLDGRGARLLRRRFLELATARKFPGLHIGPDVVITGYSTLILGTNVSIHRWSHITAEGGLEVGDNVSIGHRTSILTTEHSFDDLEVPIKSQPLSFHAVSIGNDVWIGANVTILGGVNLGSRSVVAAGAVVTNSFPEGKVVLGGVPARVLRNLPEPKFRTEKMNGRRR